MPEVLIFLTFLACTPPGLGATCESVELPVPVDEVRCAKLAPAAIAEWIGQHHGLALVGGWQCGPGRGI